MAEIFIYAIGIMYTPGPCNLLSLNAGLSGQVKSTLHFSLGMSCAMLLLFLLFGYTGTWLISPDYQILISAMGCLYIAYLAIKLIRGSVATTGKSSDNSQPTKDAEPAQSNINFKTGWIMQLLNPKALVAILPIVTVYFPAAEVTGRDIFIWSVLLSTLTFGAPCAYMLMGAKLGRLISKPAYFKVLNIGMSLLLFYVAGDIAYSHVLQQIA